MANKEPVPLCIGVLTISDTRTQANDKSGRLISESLSQAGHSVTVHRIVPDEVEAIRSTFAQWQQQSLDVVISTGGTGLTQRDVTQEAFAPFISKEIPGFGELFRWLSYHDIGTSTIQSRAFGALCEAVLVFALPGSTGAVRLALQQILLPQLDSRTMPCNFATLLPRIRSQS